MPSGRTPFAVASHLAAVGLWARVPHYAAAMPYPAASAALIDGLTEVAGLTLHAGDLHAAASVTTDRIDELLPWAYAKAAPTVNVWR